MLGGATDLGGDEVLQLFLALHGKTQTRKLGGAARLGADRARPWRRGPSWFLVRERDQRREKDGGESGGGGLACWWSLAELFAGDDDRHNWRRGAGLESWSLATMPVVSRRGGMEEHGARATDWSSPQNEGEGRGGFVLAGSGFKERWEEAAGIEGGDPERIGVEWRRDGTSP